MRRSSPAWTKRLARGRRRSSRHLPRAARASSDARDRAPSQSDTAILPSERGSGARLCCSTTSRPAAVIHCATVSGAKPSRRCACSSRRNSRSCGAKSTTSSRPAGPQHARRLGDGARAVVEEVQHLMDDDDVEGILRQREVVDVALPHAAMPAARRGRAARARAPACRATGRGRGRARSRGPNSSSMRPVPVPRSSSERNGSSASAPPIASSTASSATCSLRMRSHSAAWRRK